MGEVGEPSTTTVDRAAELLGSGDELRDALNAEYEAISGLLGEVGDRTGRPGPSAVGGLRRLVGQLSTNQHFIADVHGLLRRRQETGSAMAGPKAESTSGSDQVVLDAATVSDLLEGSAGHRAPEPIDVSALTRCGGLYRPPGGILASSFAVDDVSGNFVYGTVDLANPGTSSALDCRRFYNSRAGQRRGLFGWGWSSLIDMRADAGGLGTVEVTFADGRVVRFQADVDSSGPYEAVVDGPEPPAVAHQTWIGLPAPHHRMNLRFLGFDQGWSLVGDLTGSIDDVDDDRPSPADRLEVDFDPAGSVVRLQWGSVELDVERAESRVIVTDRGSGRWVRYQLDDGVVVAAVDDLNRTVEYAYDAGDHLVRVDRPAGRVSYVMQSSFLVAVVDGEGVVEVKNRYDHQGRVVDHRPSPQAARSTPPSGGGEQSASAARWVNPARPDVVEDPDGVRHRLSWTDSGALSSIAGPPGPTGRSTDMTVERDRFGLPKAVRTSSGTSVVVVRDDAGRPVEIQSPDGRETIEYSNLGRPRTGTLLDGSSWSISYDERGLPGEVRRRWPGTETVVSCRYDDIGHLVETVTRTSGRPDLQRSWTYDLDGRMTAHRLTQPAEPNTAAPADAAGSGSPPSSAPAEAPGDPDNGDPDNGDGGGIDGLEVSVEVAYVYGTSGSEAPSAMSVVVDGDISTRLEVGRTSTDDGFLLHGGDGSRFAVRRSPHVVEVSVAAEQAAEGTPGFDSPTGAVSRSGDDSTTTVRSDADGTIAVSHGGHPLAVLGLSTGGRPISVRSDSGPGGARSVSWSYHRNGLTDLTNDWTGRIVPGSPSVRSSPGGRHRVDDPITARQASSDPPGAALGVEPWLVELDERLGGPERPVTLTDPSGRPVLVVGADTIDVLTNDGLGRRVESRRRHGGDDLRRAIVRDGQGRIVETSIGARGDGLEFELGLEYDHQGRTSAITYGDGTSVAMVYSSPVADPGVLIGYRIDGVAVDPPDPGALQLDGDGRPTVDEEGRLVTFDQVGRVTEIFGLDGRRRRFIYDGPDPAAPLRSVDDGAGERFDFIRVDGRLNRVDDPVRGSVSLTFDAANRLVGDRGVDGSSTTIHRDLSGTVTDLVIEPADGDRRHYHLVNDVDGRPVHVIEHHAAGRRSIPIRWDHRSGLIVGLGDVGFLHHHDGRRGWFRPLDPGRSDADTPWLTGSWDDPWGFERRPGVRLGRGGRLLVDRFLFVGPSILDTRNRCWLERRSPGPGSGPPPDLSAGADIAGLGLPVPIAPAVHRHEVEHRAVPSELPLLGWGWRLWRQIGDAVGPLSSPASGAAVGSLTDFDLLGRLADVARDHPDSWVGAFGALNQVNQEPSAGGDQERQNDADRGT